MQPRTELWRDLTAISDSFGWVQSVPQLLSQGISTVLLIGALVVFICLIWGGWQWLTAGGDEGQMQQAKERLTQCLVGFAILAVSYAIALLVQYFLGLNIFRQDQTTGGLPPVSSGPPGGPPVPLPPVQDCNYSTYPSEGCAECFNCTGPPLNKCIAKPGGPCNVTCWSGGICGASGCALAPGATYTCTGNSCPSQPCTAPGACIGGICYGPCTGPGGCPSPYQCVGGSCALPPTSMPTPAPGTIACVNDTICSSGNHCGRDADNDRFLAIGVNAGFCFPVIYPYTDCYDQNRNAHPDVTGYFIVNRGDGSFDYNCVNGEEKFEDCVSTIPAVVSCTITRPISSDITGWVGSSPNCGEIGIERNCWGYRESLSCGPDSGGNIIPSFGGRCMSLDQACHLVISPPLIGTIRSWQILDRSRIMACR